MDNEKALRRRQLLALAAGGTTSLAGCSAFGNSSTTTAENETETPTVVFTETDTDTPTPTNTATATTNNGRIFTGGTLADFRAALHAASSLPDATLQVDPGTYRFEPLREVEPGNKRAHARVTGIGDVTIEGNGAKFVFTDPLRTGIRIMGGRDVTVRDLTLDYDPVPFTQGEIVDLGPDRRRITLAVDDGYPSLSNAMFDNAARVWASVHQADGSFVEGIRKEDGFDKFFSSIESVGNRRFELSLRNGVSPNGVAVGHRLTVVARNHGTAWAFYMTERPVVEDVTAYASGGSVFSAAVCSDPVFRRTTIIPPPDGDRQVASDADGIRIVNCRSSATIEGCRHECLLDDSIVVQQKFTSVTELLDEHTVGVEGVHPFVVGSDDTLEALSQSGVRLGDLPAIAYYESRFSSPGSREKPATITFEEPIAETLSVGDYIGNRETGSQNFTVRNNELRDHRGILVRVVARNGAVTGNVLDGASRNPVELECDNDENFAPKGYVDDVTVENNTIRRAGMVYFAGDHPAGIRIHLLTRQDVPEEGQPNRNIRLLNNDIEMTAGVGIDIENAAGIEVAGNRIADVNRLDYGPYGISVAKARDVTIVDNTVEGTSDRLQYFGQRNDSSEVTMEDNALRIDGESTSASLE
ncbi:right-handed parallel beta-helix repeat-containing protein [Halomicrobium urmianum]|uniref:right-handed parallel beta-helix repeat-containing protein n=1 Tax=Halomicrobium urmianum TaxID=1586233 RepID=UPI001CD9BFF5|nr:right-handed parallel beta-helix repeat-containing protein [Halomicrobium urmianum]